MHIKHLVITDYKGVLDTKIMESIVAKAMEPYREQDCTGDQCEACKLAHCQIGCIVDAYSKWDYYTIHSTGYGDFADGQPAMPVADIENMLYHSVVMPNGAWVERGDEHGDVWRQSLYDILTTYGYCRAILVDYHC